MTRGIPFGLGAKLTQLAEIIECRIFPYMVAFRGENSPVVKRRILVLPEYPLQPCYIGVICVILQCYRVVICVILQCYAGDITGAPLSPP